MSFLVLATQTLSLRNFWEPPLRISSTITEHPEVIRTDLRLIVRHRFYSSRIELFHLVLKSDSRRKNMLASRKGIYDLICTVTWRVVMETSYDDVLPVSNASSAE